MKIQLVSEAAAPRNNQKKVAKLIWSKFLFTQQHPSKKYEKLEANYMAGTVSMLPDWRPEEEKVVAFLRGATDIAETKAIHHLHFSAHEKSANVIISLWETCKLEVAKKNRFNSILWRK